MNSPLNCSLILLFIPHPDCEGIGTTRGQEGVAIAVVEDFPLKVPTPSRSPISLSSLPQLTHSCPFW